MFALALTNEYCISISVVMCFTTNPDLTFFVLELKGIILVHKDMIYGSKLHSPLSAKGSERSWPIYSPLLLLPASTSLSVLHPSIPAVLPVLDLV